MSTKAKALLRLITVIGLILSARAVVATGNEMASADLGFTDTGLRYFMSVVDEMELVLLDRHQLEDDWRDHFDDQILGFGVRSDRMAMSKADVKSVKDLLLDSSNWSTGLKDCLVAGDAAILTSM